MICNEFIQTVIDAIGIVVSAFVTVHVMKRTLRSEKEIADQASLEAAEQFEKHLAIEQEKERLLFLPFFNFEFSDISISGDTICKNFKFSVTNAGGNSAVNPHIALEEPGHLMLEVDKDLDNGISYTEISPISTAIARAGDVCNFKLRSIDSENTMNGTAHSSEKVFSFCIDFSDLIGNSYRQEITLYYDSIANTATRREITPPVQISKAMSE